MTRADLLTFMRGHRMAVQASVTVAGVPQAAVVGIIVTDTFELLFDTLDTSRKVANLRTNSRIAFVIGGTSDGEGRTVQYEGLVDVPRVAALKTLKDVYLTRFPDGHERQRWPGLVYVHVRPTWLRYSDFGVIPPVIVELTASQLENLA